MRFRRVICPSTGPVLHVGVEVDRPVARGDAGVVAVGVVVVGEGPHPGHIDPAWRVADLAEADETRGDPVVDGEPRHLCHRPARQGTAGREVAGVADPERVGRVDLAPGVATAVPYRSRQ